MTHFNLHTHHFTNQANVLELVNQFANAYDETVRYYSIGIHPWYIEENRIITDLAFIESKLQQKNCLALGECGLDKRITTSLELQKEVFEKQLLLAQKYNKPVVVHCVAAFQELIATKKKLQITVPMVVHGFSKNASVAKSLLDDGFYLSFGKYLLHNPALELVFKKVPNNQFFLETDMISESIFDIYEKANTIKATQLEQVIIDNFESVFKIKMGSIIKN
jgi:TatD DNase family protein